MRRLTSRAFIILMGAILGFKSALHAYTQAEDLILAERDPFTTQATLDSDYRLRGMGGLDLAIDDESNKVGTFKYGQAPAGLAQDYPQSKAEFGILSEGGTLKDKESNGTAYTGDVADVGQATFQGMVAVRTGHTPESHGAFATSLLGEGIKFDYNSSYKSQNGFSKLEDEPSLGNFNIGYGHQLGQFLIGFGINSVDSTPFDIKSVSGGLRTDVKSEVEILDVVPSVGYVAPLASGALSFTLSPRFRNQDETTTLSTTGTTEVKSEQDGMLLDVGAHYGNGKAIQSALYLTFGGIDGDIKSNGSNVATAETDRADIRFRLYGRPQDSRFSFGFLIESLGTDSDVEVPGGAKITDDKETDTKLGGGLAFHFAEDKGLIGFELRLLNNKLEDGLNSANDEETKGVELRLGGEHIVGSKLWLRAGFNVKSLDSEPQGGPTLNATVSQLTLGGEYNFTDRASLALNLSSIGIASEGSSSAFVDKEEYAGGSIQLLGKLHFGEAATN